MKIYIQARTIREPYCLAENSELYLWFESGDKILGIFYPGIGIIYFFYLVNRKINIYHSNKCFFLIFILLNSRFEIGECDTCP